MADETQAEIQYRLHCERRCRELADILKAHIDPGMAFTLVTATIGEDESFRNMSYVSTGRREDMARMLTELLDYFQSEGQATEPTPQTMTMLREWVFKMRREPLQKLLTNAQHRAGNLRGIADPKDRAAQALVLASEALSIFDQESARARRQQKACEGD